MVILYYILLIATLIYGLYFALTGLWAFIRAPKKTAPSDTEKKNNFLKVTQAILMDAGFEFRHTHRVAVSYEI